MRRELERVGEAVVLRESLGGERRMRGLDHLHRTARIELMSRQVGIVGEDRLVHEPGPAVPVILRARRRQHGNEAEVRVLGRPPLRQIREVEILLRAHAPVENHVAPDPGVERVLEHAFYRREAGRARDEDHRLVAVLAQEERTERALELDHLAHLHAVEHVGREASSGNEPDLQFDFAARVGGGREREAALFAVVEQDVDVLPGAKAQRPLADQGEAHLHHVVGKARERHDACAMPMHGKPCRCNARHVFEFDVGERRRTARQHLARGDFGVAQRIGLVDAVVDAAGQQRAFAYAAAAVAAIERKRDLLAQCRFEQRFAGVPGHDPMIGMDQHAELVRAREALRRQPRQQHEQQRAGTDDHPYGTDRPAVEQGKYRQVEPVERKRRGDRAEICDPLAHRRLREGQHDHCPDEPRHDPARRVRLRAGDALRVDPQQCENAEREADMQERQQREQAVVDGALEDEVAHQRAIENGQPVEPLGGTDRHELREPIPRQHVTVDARYVDEPQHSDARNPREPAETAVAIEHEVARQVQQHAEHHAVGGVAMQAAHHAADVPPVVRERLDRRVRFLDAGLEEDVEVEAARDDDPEQEVRDRAEVVERVVRFTERVVEHTLDVHEEPLAAALQVLQHRRGPWRARKKPAAAGIDALPPGGGNARMPTMLVAHGVA